MSVRIPGRIDLDETRLKYHHEAEHRGHGIVAIYSYGPAGEHTALVRESKRVMNRRFGVTGAVSSGGISGYPENRPTPDPDWRTALCETQTIFGIHAVSGCNRPKLVQAPKARADWHLSYLLDEGRGPLCNYPVDVYLAGPLEPEEVWLEKIAEWTVNSPALEVTVRAVPEGAYWFLADGDPIVQWRNR